ncbi:ABC1 family protein C21C3.03 [Fusarium oxysporum f. sp. albedinis]|nr:ABC1 family protein C21C3.03 [Fusarium oxysporum f. sp. albedinis]
MDPWACSKSLHVLNASGLSLGTTLVTESRCFVKISITRAGCCSPAPGLQVPRTLTSQCVLGIGSLQDYIVVPSDLSPHVGLPRQLRVLGNPSVETKLGRDSV